jgi:hypothetical protein
MTREIGPHRWKSRIAVSACHSGHHIHPFVVTYRHSGEARPVQPAAPTAPHFHISKSIPVHRIQSGYIGMKSLHQRTADKATPPASYSRIPARATGREGATRWKLLAEPDSLSEPEHHPFGEVAFRISEDHGRGFFGTSAPMFFVTPLEFCLLR